jgi:hypothetical protein
MNAQRDPDRLIRSFLMEGAEQLDDQIYDAVRAEIDQRRQRVVIGPWRMPDMNKLVPIGLGAAAVVVALVIGVRMLGPTARDGVGGTPTAEPSAPLTSSPSITAPSPSLEGSLPEGPLLVWESQDQDAPSITMTISAPGWIRGTADATEWLEKGEGRDNMPEAAILPDSMPPGTGFYVSGDPCRWASTRPETPATTVEEVVAALAAQASRDPSEPVDVTMGGYAGKMITLHVPDDADFAACDDGEFVSYTDEDGERWHWHQGPGQVDDFWFVNVDGSIVEIRAMYRPDTPIELLAEMRTLVESATFQFP